MGCDANENLNIDPFVSIIILNWNGWRDTIECLESVNQITYPNYNVILVDNGSTNESIVKIKEYSRYWSVLSFFFKYSKKNKPFYNIQYSEEEIEFCDDNVEVVAGLHSKKKMILIRNEKNYGFAEGNNIAIRYAMKASASKYVLLLNNDVVVDKVFLDELVRVAESDEKIGFVGPKIFFYDFFGRRDIIDFAGGDLNLWVGRTKKKKYKHIDDESVDNILSVDYFEASCLLVKTDVIRSIGYLNSYFFTYWEDVDWCMRAKNAGYHILYVPTSKIWHKISASNKGTSKSYYSTRNRIKILRQYATGIQLVFFFIYFFGFEFWVYCVILLCISRDKNTCISFINGVIDGCK